MDRCTVSSLDERTGSVARPGNQVRLLFDGVRSFAAREQLIRNARSSIHLQTFIFTSDETGWRTARLLAQAAKRGVKVRVLYDSLGSCHSDGRIFDYMREHGVELRGFGNPWTHPLSLNWRWHEKHLIADGRTSVEGGLNIADEYAFGGSGKLVMQREVKGELPFRDVDVMVTGPAVLDAQAAFLRNWEYVGGVVDNPAPLLPPTPPLSDGCTVRMVQHRPGQEGDDNTRQLYLDAIARARHHVVIENAYFLPCAEIRQALCDAARRGVTVCVLTNSPVSNNHPFVTEAAHYAYPEMLAAGVRILERNTRSTLHAKTATFDGVYSLVGSCNLNGRSAGRDSEFVVAIHDRTTARALEARFIEGREAATRVTAEMLSATPWWRRTRQWAMHLFRWTF